MHLEDSKKRSQTSLELCRQGCETGFEEKAVIGNGFAGREREKKFVSSTVVKLTCDERKKLRAKGGGSRKLRVENRACERIRPANKKKKAVVLLWKSGWK